MYSIFLHNNTYNDITFTQSRHFINLLQATTFIHCNDKLGTRWLGSFSTAKQNAVYYCSDEDEDDYYACRGIRGRPKVHM